MTIKISINEILSDIQHRVEDRILEPSNAALLTKLIQNAESLDEAIKIAELGTTYKRTGFHFDKRLEKQTNDISYFKKNEELSFETDKNSITHKLVIGDNYLGLLNLLVEYRGKIDVIYIDPPYGKDSMGEFAQTNYDNAITRDNLLSMLYPRLVLAKQLLSESGVIFCSIDDRNQAYVKGLFDEVFEERNFIGTFKWNKVAKAPSLSDSIRTKYEYILAYYKKERIKLFGKDSYNIQAPLWHLPNKINELVFPAKSIVVKQSFNKGYYGGKYNVELLDDLIEDNGLNKYEIRIKANSSWGQQKINEYIKNGATFEIKKSPKTFYTTLDNDDKYIAPSDLITKKECDVGTNTDANTFMEDIEIPFDYTKPVSLIQYLIQMIRDTDIIVLDFFAGSGTTGHAVQELNKNDGGDRQFILVQLDEDLDVLWKNSQKSDSQITLKNQIITCDMINRPHKLSEITVERLRRVMTGKSLNGKSDFKWIKTHNPLGGNLQVIDLKEVSNFESVKGKTPFEVIDETLYGIEKMTVKDKTEWVCDNFEITQKRELVK